MKRNEIIFAGFGGQGVIKAALLVTHAAGLYEGKEVVQTQSYGPEARGGACRSEVIISEDAIDYVKALHVDSFVVMSQPALDKYVDQVDPEKTYIIADATLIARIPEKLKRVYRIAATRIAEEEFGRALFANIIMLGAFSAITGTIELASLEKTLEGNVPPKTLETNRRALARGYELGKAQIEGGSSR